MGRVSSARCLCILAVLVGLPGPSAIAAPAASKPAVVRDGAWLLRTSLSGGAAESTFVYGRPGDVPVMGDWDGDGTKTPGVVRGKIWYLKNTNAGGAADIVLTYGREGDIPIVGDWDGDGDDTPGVARERVTCDFDFCIYRPNEWYLRNSNTSGTADVSFEFASIGEPVAGDWDGDGDDTPGLRRRNTNIWDINNGFDTTADQTFQYGRPGDIPVAGDWNGDGSDTLGVVRGKTWYLKNSLAGGDADTTFAYGRPGDRFLVWR